MFFMRNFPPFHVNLWFPSQKTSHHTKLEKIGLDKFKNRKVPKIHQIQFNKNAQQNITKASSRYFISACDEFNELLDKQFN